MNYYVLYSIKPEGRNFVEKFNNKPTVEELENCIGGYVSEEKTRELAEELHSSGFASINNNFHFELE